MKKAATPEALSMTFPQLKLRFRSQVESHPCAGQRHHHAQNAAGREHIQCWDAPSTQSIIHAVRVVGKLARQYRKLVLIDGYHRLLHWFDMNECPFATVWVMAHPIDAGSEAELLLRIDALARTIDSKNAVKKNMDRWCAAVRDAGLTAPQSKAYTVGYRSLGLFKRVLLSPKAPMPQMTACAKEDIVSHRTMDILFSHCEREMSRRHADDFFHTGVQAAIFQGLRKLAEDRHTVAVAQLCDMLLKLDKANTSTPYRLAVLSRETEALYAHLVYLASPEKVKALRALGNREVYYDAVAVELKPLMEAFVSSVAKAGKKRIRKAS